MRSSEQRLVVASPEYTILDFASLCCQALIRQAQQMKALVLIAGTCLLLGSCASNLVTGQHVPVTGAGTPEAKTLLAKRVLSALPEARVRARLRERFPQLTERQLERVHLTCTVMNLYRDSNAREPSDRQIHLVVEVNEDDSLHPVAHEIEEFVASLFRAELRRIHRA